MENKNATRPCPICRNESVEVLHHQRFVLPEGSVLPDAFDVVWCARCGFAYADTPATQETYDSYYADFSKYEDSSTSTGGGGSDFDSRRLRDTAAAIAAVVTDRKQRIVDIGCANGGLLEELRKLEYTELLGVDPSPACVANTRNAYGIAAAPGAIRQMPEGIGRFDLIILSHVLEHVADLQAVIRDLTALLNPSGRIYVEVPDAARYREFLLAPFQDFNTEHINHFGLSALRNLFEPHGFVTEDCGQKDIESSPGCPYPAAYCFFRLQDSPLIAAHERKLEVDHSFLAGMRDYIAASRRKLDEIEERLAPFASRKKALIVWGTGQLTMKLLAETSLGSADVTAFIDGNPVNQGKRLNGVPIVAPGEITDRETPILLATLLHEKAIREMMQKLDLPNPVIALGG